MFIMNSPLENYVGGNLDLDIKWLHLKLFGKYLRLWKNIFRQKFGFSYVINYIFVSNEKSAAVEALNIIVGYSEIIES